MSKKDVISIKNARVHNLKNISLDIPKNKLTVITGLSGSGKSSLAFDTIYAEGQRRYAESLNAYARQFMDLQDKPDVDDIEGLSPTIAIDQKTISRNPRSTVGTTTEIYDYLRLLFARIGVQHCPSCDIPVTHSSPGEITESVRALARKKSSVTILSPLLRGKQVKQRSLLTELEHTGLNRIRINGVEQSIHDIKSIKFDSSKKYDVDIILGDITDPKRQDIQEIIENALEYGNGSLMTITDEEGEQIYNTKPECKSCGHDFDHIESRSFSFNSPHGACTRCTGLGITLDVDPELVIPNKRLTLAEGAIQPWTRIVGNQNKYQDLLQAVSEEHGFSINAQIKDLSKKTIDLIFYGTNKQEYRVGKKKMHYEGVVSNLLQRHAETDSEYVRKEIETYMRERVCPMCDGKRLKKSSIAVKIGNWNIANFCEKTIEEAIDIFKTLEKGKKGDVSFTKLELAVASPLSKEILKRLQNLINVGLYYISLDRSVHTLSGGEAQRVRLSSQLSTGLTGVIYILDEPSIGLHAKDNNTLIATLKKLRDLGNTVIVVEHDRSMMESADFIVDVGPGAGTGGGQIVATGDATAIEKKKASQTGQFLSGKICITIPKKRRKGNGKTIDIIGAKAFNLKNIDVSIPLGTLTCVTGVSGSGKSSLIIDILSKALHKKFYRAKAEPGNHNTIKGMSNIEKVISIDQSPIGRTPRSNPATYTGIFTSIRDVFTDVPEAKIRGMDAGKFSFNVKGGGRCEACTGQGYVTIPMQFLSDVFVECAECAGRRYNKEALEIHYRNKTIADVLSMTVEDAYRFFRDVPSIEDKLRILRDVGLGYVQLGQSATTLSGGEAQRIKLGAELARRSTGDTLYILDEPTTGLHFADIERLLGVLTKLVEKGNTVLIIEHNLDVIKSADWVIDMGPDGGKRGGNIVAEGTPETITKNKSSYTGLYLKALL